MTTDRGLHRLSYRWVFLTVLLCVAGGTGADSGEIILDGLRDAEYVLVATDPGGDLASPGPGDLIRTAWADLTELWMWSDNWPRYRQTL